ncbi:AAA family ATPase [Burkholderia pseudomallei]|nr:AAA family ATPase [Burkholderia pseudomallei]
MSAKITPTAEEQADSLPLHIKYADTLKSTRAHISELLENLLTSNGLSAICGAANVGKTALVIDMVSAISRGAEWMNRQTQQGLVLYMAAESPVSVESRVLAYQEHHALLMPNFIISDSRVNLFKDGKGTDDIIKTVTLLEKKHNQKVVLIVFDTLSLVIEGANENLGADMGRVIENLDRIRRACGAHVSVVHHIGKQADAGMRGWSGLFAAMDTVIMIAATKRGSYAEVVKSRDLGCKGIRIGFDLKAIGIGKTTFGKEATACVAVPADAPPKGSGYGKVEAAILKFLKEHDGGGISKAGIVQHFNGKPAKGSVYRAINALAEDSEVVITGDKVALAIAEQDVEF